MSATPHRGKNGDASPPPSRRSSPPETAAQTNVSLWVRLLESHNLMLAEVRRRLADDCTMPRFDLLANLEREDGQTLAALSRRMLVTAGNLTGLVDRAERDGVVERRADPSDRRLSRVYLTPKGRELIVGLLPTHGTHITHLLEGLDPVDRKDLRRLLGKLRDSLMSKGSKNAHAQPSHASQASHASQTSRTKQSAE